MLTLNSKKKILRESSTTTITITIITIITGWSTAAGAPAAAVGAFPLLGPEGALHRAKSVWLWTLLVVQEMAMNERNLHHEWKNLAEYTPNPFPQPELPWSSPQP